MRRALALLAVAALLTGCGGGGTDLERMDPHGYRACMLLAESRTATGEGVGSEGEQRLGAILEASNEAAQADTEAIRDAAGDEIGDADLHLPPDEDALEVACEAEGIDIPADRS